MNDLFEKFKKTGKVVDYLKYVEKKKENSKNDARGNNSKETGLQRKFKNTIHIDI